LCIERTGSGFYSLYSCEDLAIIEEWMGCNGQECISEFANWDTNNIIGWTNALAYVEGFENKVILIDFSENDISYIPENI
jgi:hypothetical protein